MRVILEVIEGPQTGEQFVFERREAFVIGRKKNSRVQFRIPDDPYLSRYHLRIEVSPPHCSLRDIGSRNGTRVNGKKVRDADLKDGDVIRAGRTEMLVRIEESQPEPAPAPRAPQPPIESPDSPVTPDMDTKVLGSFGPSHGSPGVFCATCKRPAHDTHLGDLTETRIIAYVCPDCLAKHEDPQYPVPNYEKLKVLKRGNLGPVYKARRVSTDMLVVLKILSRDLTANPQAVSTFLRQMSLAAGLRHDNIVPIVELGQAGQDLWLASEYVEGCDAAELARRLGGTVPWADAVEIICRILDALHYAHGQNLVHRDVKPSNILVSGQPGSYSARLADFGLMRNMDEAGVSGITRKGEVRGTVPFMPREQVLDCRFVKPAGDVYAAGATLYWLLTGELTRDFEALDLRGEVKDAYLVILDDPVVPIRERDPAVPESIARVLDTALADEPEDRYDTAAEMARALRRAISES